MTNKQTFICERCHQPKREVIAGVRPLCDACASAAPSGPLAATTLDPRVAYGYPAAYAQPLQQPAAPVQQVVTVQADQRSRVPHLLHFVLTILTGGLWLVVWIIDTIVRGR